MLTTVRCAPYELRLVIVELQAVGLHPGSDGGIQQPSAVARAEEKDASSIESIQRLFGKRILGLATMTYCSRLKN